MVLRRKGRYWTTNISKQAIADFEEYHVPPFVQRELARQFHRLGDIKNPADDSRMMQIARRDVPRGIFRFKSRQPQYLLQIRGLVMVFEVKGKAERGAIYLAGVFIRDENTYESTLTNRLTDLGIFKRA